MLTFLSSNWLWIILFLGGMVLMHRAHGGHGGAAGGHGSAAGGHGGGCGGGHGNHSSAHQGDSEHAQHTEPADAAGDGAGRSLTVPPVS